MKNEKRSRNFQIKINLTNRWLYTLIAIGILAIVGVGVWAATYSNSGAGHPYTEISTCGTNGQILKMSGGAWTCVDMPSVVDTRCDTSGTCSQVCIGTNCKSSWPSAGADSDWIISGNNMYSGVSGNVGIGTTSPSQKLHVNGNVLAAAYYYSSDKNLKTNIQPLQDSLSKILQLDGVSFNWKENGEESIGLIAQEVEKVFPEIVSSPENGFKSVDYGKLVTVLIEAIKEQQIQIDVLKKEVGELKKK